MIPATYSRLADRSWHDTGRTVCAFLPARQALLNQRGGQVLFGVTQDRTVVEQQVGKRIVSERLWCKRCIPPYRRSTLPRHIPWRR